MEPRILLLDDLHHYRDKICEILKKRSDISLINPGVTEDLEDIRTTIEEEKSHGYLC